MIAVIILVMMALLFLATGVCMTKRKEGKWWRHPFLSAAGCFCERAERFVGGRRWASEQVREDLEGLGEGRKRSDALARYYREKIARVLLVLFVGSLIVAVWQVVQERQGADLPSLSLARNAPGEGARTEILSVEGDGWGEASRVEVTVPEQIYTEEDFLRITNEEEAAFRKEMLGGNASIKEVREDLVFGASFLNYPFSVSWMSSDPSLIDAMGQVKNEGLSGVKEMEVTAEISYRSFIARQRFQLSVRPPLMDRQQEDMAAIHEALEEQREGEGETIVLPKSVAGRRLHWERWSEKPAAGMIWLVLLLAVILFLHEDHRLHAKAEARKRQMELDYPLVLGRMVLLLGTGIPMRSVWKKIVEDGEKDPKERERYLFREMRIAVREMESGTPERDAYEHFGERAGTAAFRKLAALLTRNLQKGNRGLAEALSQEVRIAYDERRALAKTKGEEAGTKLLLPMMMQLVVILLIVIVPAFLGIS